MKVFISWSGQRSKQVAFALREWLPSIINDVEPWVSEEDIAKGAHWPTHLGRELQDAKFGIICLTPENLTEPWILFEGGALAKSLEEARVTPYLFDLEKIEVKPPLGHFQASTAEKSDTKKLLQSINATVEQCQGRFLPPQRFDAAFEKWWPDLDTQLAEIPKHEESKLGNRPREEVLGEILETVRGLARDVPAAIRELQSQRTPVSITTPILPDYVLQVLGSLPTAPAPPGLMEDEGARKRIRELMRRAKSEQNQDAQKKDK